MTSPLYIISYTIIILTYVVDIISYTIIILTYVAVNLIMLR